MKFSKSTKLAGSLFLTVLVSNVPNVVLAEHLQNTKQEMISTAVVLAQISRAEAENEIRDYLQTTNVRSEMLSKGLSPEEASDRLASLSEQEIQQLSVHVKEARAGGDPLVTVLLVLLIIFLIQRIL